MKDKKPTYLDLICEKHEEEGFLKADGFDDAILGVDESSMRLIYSVTKCVGILMDEGMTEEDAIDHFSYNVVSAYVGEKTPIWCQDDFY